MKLGGVHLSKLVFLQLVIAVLSLYLAWEERQARKKAGG